MALAIRPMRPDDLEATVAAGLRGGWGDRRAWLEFALAHAACDPLVAADRGGIVGTGVGTRSGAAGWVGTIFVVPERRREGIGLALSAAVCERLEAAGCRTLLLVATDQGRPVYERLGFEEDGWYRTLEHDGTGRGAPLAEAARLTEAARLRGPGLHAFGPGDVEDAALLDRSATGEDRSHLLAAFASNPRGLALRDSEGSMAGFVVRGPWGGGATVARTIADAERLLAARLAAVEPGHPVRAGLLETNEAGRQRLAELGWIEIRRMIRMRRGSPLDWRPERIWGQFNFAMG